MKTITITLTFLCLLVFPAIAQEKGTASRQSDTLGVKNLSEFVVSALRINIPLRQIPAAISVMSNATINAMSKTISADDALRLVPGVRIDNGTGGSRVHVYIRGQGVLTESGFRGIGVYMDGISLNTPGGFCPDLYDVDWETVKNVEVVKGLSASMYGASATGGIVNITTNDGSRKPVSSYLYTSAGSNGFWKILGQVDGTRGDVNYRISYSHVQSHGYRIHQSYMADNLNEKLTWTPVKRLKVTQILTYTSYFNQNSEGINLSRYDTVGHRAANTDAIRYNEFHKTQRLTGAAIVKWEVARDQDITLKGFIRMNNYQETSNNGDDHKPFITPGITAQYNLHSGEGNLVNHLSLGGDYQSMKMTEHLIQVPDGDHINDHRVDSYWSEEVFDLNTLLISQVIRQRGLGVFLIDKLDLSQRLYAMVNLRYDYVYNRLDSCSVSDSKTFSKPTWRIGLAYDAARAANIYASIGTGFLIPTEDELYNNPDKYGGFNQHIEPTSSMGAEVGVRGEIGQKFYYDITGFNILSKNEFYRYSVPGRGNNTAFYGNMGESRRRGVETSLSYTPVDFLKFDVAYAYSHFRYTSPDSVNGHHIPQCPDHALTAEGSVKFLRNFLLTFNLQYNSRWYIQVDDSIYEQYTENGIKRSSSERTGFTVASATLKYNWKLASLSGDISLYCKNLFDEQYFGFTEPNNGPDYNSYQAAPGREFFVSLRLRL